MKALSMKNKSKSKANGVSNKITHNHLRKNHLETEARMVAKRYVNGEVGIADNLTKTEPARFHISNTQKIVLPSFVKKRYETAFNTDLSNVRIHKSKSIDELTSVVGAKAFVAGNDIYMSQNSYNPYSHDGQELLAHELAHTIQQCSTRVGDSMVVNISNGAGDLQFDNILPRFRQPSLSLDEMIDIYKDNLTSAEIENLDLLKAEFESAFIDVNGIEGFQQKVNENRWGVQSNEYIRGFLIDHIKLYVLNQYYSSIDDQNMISLTQFNSLRETKREWIDLQKQLFYLDPSTKTLLHEPHVAEEYIQDIGVNWLGYQLEQESINTYFPNHYMDAFRIFLFGTRMQVQALRTRGEGASEYSAWLRNKRDNAESNIHTLTNNELYYVAAELLRIENKERIDSSVALFDQIDAVYGASPEYIKKLQFAISMKQELEIKKNSITDDFRKLNPIALLIDDLIDLHQKSIELWTSIKDTYQQGLRINFNSDPLLQAKRDETEALLTQVSDLIFRRVNLPTQNSPDRVPRVPGRRVYRAGIRTARRRIDVFEKLTIQAELIRLTKQQNSNPTLAVGLGYLMTLLDDIYSTLGEYRYDDDRINYSIPNTVESRNSQFGSDYRVYHRHLAARKLLQIGRYLMSDSIQQIAISVLTAEDSGRRISEVALLDTWREDTSIEISDFASEEKGFQNLPLRGLHFLTPVQIANIFLGIYYDTGSSAIEQILDGTGNQSGEEGYFTQIRPRVRTRIQSSLDSVSLPKRYKIPSDKYSIARNSNDTNSIYNIISEHPITKRLYSENNITELITESSNKSLAIWRVHDPAPGDELFFWTIPSFEPIVGKLREITELDRLVQSVLESIIAQREIAAPDTPEIPIDAPYWLKWFIAFTNLDNALITQDIITEFTAYNEWGFSVSYDRYVRNSRRAWRQDRKLLIKHRVLPLMQEFDNHDISTFSNPNTALSIIEDFSYDVYPRTDREVHEAIAFLELFKPPINEDDDFLPEIKQTRRFDLIITWLNALSKVERNVELFYNVGISEFIENQQTQYVLTNEERNSTNWISSSLTRIAELKQAMETAKREAQLQSGFSARKTSDNNPGKHVLSSISSAFEITPDSDFTIHNVVWRLVEVVHDFDFYPDYGNPSNFDSYTAPRLIVEGTESPVDPETKQITGNRLILRVIRNGHEVRVHENDNALLEEILDAVIWQNLVQNLQNLQEVIETATEIFLTGLEFVPGVGQAVMITRLATSVLSFILSPEFEQIKEQVFEDPLAFLAGLEEIVSGELFESDRFISWMLLGDLVPGQISSPRRRTRRQRPRSRSRSRSGAIAKFAVIIQRLTTVGRRFSASLGRTRTRAGQKYLSASSFVNTHPRLASVFSVIGEFAPFFADTDMIREVSNIIDHIDLDVSELNDFPNQINSLIEAINSLELPEELLPMGTVLEVIVELVLDRLGARYRMGGRALLFVMDQLGLKQQLFDGIARQIPDDANPNYHWQKFVNDTLQSLLNTFRMHLISGINDIFEDFNLTQLDKNLGSDNRIEMEGDNFPDTLVESNLPSSTPILSEQKASQIAQKIHLNNSGAPITQNLRDNLENDFGHDFSHVRMHNDSEAANFTNNFNADAITTGSHIYVKPSLNLDSVRGNYVLRHELSHVLQNTGPRPTYANHSSRPIIPNTRTGIQYNEIVEQNADLMANQSKDETNQIVQVSGNSNQLFYPSLSLGSLGSFFKKLSTTEILLQHYRSRVDQSGTIQAAHGVTLATDVQTQVNNVASSIRSIMTGSNVQALDFDRSFTDVQTKEKLTNFFRNHFGTVSNLQSHVEHVASESMVEKRTRRIGRTPSSQNQTPVFKFDFRLFSSALEAFFFSRGLIMQIRFNTSTRDDVRVIDSGNPVANIKLTYIDLSKILTSTDLWSLFVKNTWNFDRTSDRDRWDKHVPLLKSFLQALGVKPNLYESSNFKLRRSYKNDFDSYFHRRQTGDPGLDPRYLPEVREYLAPDNAKPANQGPSGVIALITGTHYQLTHADKGDDRQSHHTTQFLLVEYFSNWKTLLKPFKHDLSSYRSIGLTSSNGTPATFEDISTNGSAINIAGLAGTSQSDRGPHMPAISISTLAHQTGGLHLQAQKPGDDMDGSRATQSIAVHLKFLSKLGDSRYSNALFGTESEFRNYISSNTNKRALSHTIYTSMQETYQWIRDDMRTRLVNGLKAKEPLYYNAVSTNSTHTNELEASDLNPVLFRAAENNTQIMERDNHWS